MCKVTKPHIVVVLSCALRRRQTAKRIFSWRSVRRKAARFAVRRLCAIAPASPLWPDCALSCLPRSSDRAWRCAAWIRSPALPSVSQARMRCAEVLEAGSRINTGRNSSVTMLGTHSPRTSLSLAARPSLSLRKASSPGWSPAILSASAGTSFCSAEAIRMAMMQAETAPISAVPVRSREGSSAGPLSSSVAGHVHGGQAMGMMGCLSCLSGAARRPIEAGKCGSSSPVVRMIYFGCDHDVLRNFFRSLGITWRAKRALTS